MDKSSAIAGAAQRAECETAPTVVPHGDVASDGRRYAEEERASDASIVGQLKNLGRLQDQKCGAAQRVLLPWPNAKRGAFLRKTRQLRLPPA